MIIAKEYEDLSIKAFEVIRGVVKSNPYAVLGLATGTTPLGLYRHMIEDHKAHGTSYAHIRAVNLDKYKGLPIRESGKVKLVMQGHYHLGAERTIDGIPYITLPAMCEGTDNSYQILVLDHECRQRKAVQHYFVRRDRKGGKTQ